MADDRLSKRPIIVIKRKVSHGGHHGGAWKVAYADFVTAMMSLFIVLWLLNTSPQVQKAVAGYFNDPHGRASKTGTDSLGAGSNISVDKTTVEELKAKIQKAIMQQKSLEQLSKQVEITITGEGLRVELMEGKGGTFFESGKATLNDNGIRLLDLLAAQLKGLPNTLAIEGHTDAQPYASETGYTNWELSTDRANAARRVLQASGIADTRIAAVSGYADQEPRVQTDPLDAENRRITLLVKWLPLPPGAAPAVGDTSAVAETKPGPEVRKDKMAAPVAGSAAVAGSPVKPVSGSPAAPAPAPTVAGPSGTSPSVAPSSSAARPSAASDVSSVGAAKPSAMVVKPGMFERLKQMLPGKKK